jgi:RNA polymerase sigma factor (sigma-70 family)
MTGGYPSYVPPHLAEAVTKFYHEYRPVVRTSVYGPCRETYNFEDIYHDAWFIVLKNYLKGEITTLELPYLVQVARYMCINILRKNKKITEAECVYGHPGMSDLEEEWTTGIVLHCSAVFKIIQERYGLPRQPDGLLTAKAAQILFKKRSISKLKDTDWKILSLRYYYNFSYEDIAKALDTQVGYVGVALTRYRKLMEKYGYALQRIEKDGHSLKIERKARSILGPLGQILLNESIVSESKNTKDWIILNLKCYYDFSNEAIAESLDTKVHYIGVVLNRYNEYIKNYEKLLEKMETIEHYEKTLEPYEKFLEYLERHIHILYEITGAGYTSYLKESISGIEVYKYNLEKIIDRPTPKAFILDIVRYISFLKRAIDRPIPRAFIFKKTAKLIIECKSWHQRIEKLGYKIKFNKRSKIPWWRLRRDKKMLRVAGDRNKVERIIVPLIHSRADAIKIIMSLIRNVVHQIDFYTAENPIYSIRSFIWNRFNISFSVEAIKDHGDAELMAWIKTLPTGGGEMAQKEVVPDSKLSPDEPSHNHE